MKAKSLPTKQPVTVFCSYAHEDEKLREQLDKHLKTLVRQGAIEGWNDREIVPGSLWGGEIDERLQRAQVVLLLVSPDFVASEYCYSREMTLALARHEAGEAQVIPVILKAVDLKGTPLERLQALPKDAKPVVNWTRRDDAFLDVAQGIRRVVEVLNGTVREEEYTERGGEKRVGKGPARRVKEEGAAMQTPTNATAGTTPSLGKAITRYYKELDEYKGKASYELALKTAFQNLLAEYARSSNWTLIPEETLAGNIRPDGTLRDNVYNLPRGYWEAKGPASDLDREIAKKTNAGYPLTNTIFENTREAVLYQGKRKVATYDLSKRMDLQDLLRQFATYTEPDIAKFEDAVQEFKERIPELAKSLLTIIQQAHRENRRFIQTFNTFAELCRTALNPQITTEVLNEMLIQHLLTERLFSTIFNNPDFVHRNVIAAEIEKVILALTSQAFNRNDFLKELDRFYVAIEAAARNLEDWTEKQHFLDTVYERFFQGYSVKQADTYGIVYTPQPIVEFMCASVDEILKRDFGTSLSQPGVQIIDPCVGTGNFIINILRRIEPRHLQSKYRNDLFCNEIMLLPYYISSLNIEHAYYEMTKKYEPFEGICFVDTLELAEGKQLPLFVEENTERVVREKAAQIMVVIGNPPYNMGQKNENDNNKNRHYEVIDKHIRKTYSKDSSATLNNKLYDAYVRFFRWAIDRLQERDGIVCFVSNNSFIDQIAFDGMRKHMLQDFTQIYHLDLHGNVRKNPKLSGTTHNVFGIQVGVGITIAIRSSNTTKRAINYYRVPETWNKREKLTFLAQKENITNIEWSELHPDKRHTWLIEGLYPEFETFLPIGMKETKSGQTSLKQPIFRTYSLGIATNRDEWVYDFNKSNLIEKMQRLIQNYNGEVFRWSQESVDQVRSFSSKDAALAYLDSFVTNDPAFLKWTDRLKEALYKGQMLKFEASNIRRAFYRPFCKQFLYFNHLLNQRRSQQHHIFPTSASELENAAIWLKVGSEWPMFALATNIISDLLPQGGSQCFPYYTYAEDGSNRRENITDWALAQFQSKYGAAVTKWDIFHYVYGMLHHPQYRERYAENLKRDLPHIPLVGRREAFEACARIGRELMELHLKYEEAKEYGLQWHYSDEPFSWRVERMRLTPDRSALVVNKSLTLGGIPPECFEYRLGNRSALEWVIDQYQVSKDARSGIVSDPNRVESEEEEKYIVRLVGRVVTVSVETVRLVRELAGAVRVEDWVGGGGMDEVGMEE
jgi:predicted helicase